MLHIYIYIYIYIYICDISSLRVNILYIFIPVRGWNRHAWKCVLCWGCWWVKKCGVFVECCSTVKSKINPSHWHSVQHVRHILIDCHGVDVWAMNGAGISILGRGSAGNLIHPNRRLAARIHGYRLLVILFGTSVRLPVIYSFLQGPAEKPDDF